MPGMTRTCARKGCGRETCLPAFLCDQCIQYVSTETLCQLRRAYRAGQWTRVVALQDKAITEATDAWTETFTAEALLGPAGQL